MHTYMQLLQQLRHVLQHIGVHKYLVRLACMQTIIECLKQACTGELPPNVGGNGRNWVMDPKVRHQIAKAMCEQQLLQRRRAAEAAAAGTATAAPAFVAPAAAALAGAAVALITRLQHTCSWFSFGIENQGGCSSYVPTILC